MKRPPRAAELVRRMRSAKLTVRELADSSGYHPASIKRFRSGVRAINDRAWRLIQLALSQHSDS